jgi:hypothetical protein
MRKIIYILISLIILSCSSTKTEKHKTEESKIAEIEDSANEFNKCFSELDSISFESTIGCSGGYYKVINDQYVLRISSDLNIEYDHCDIVQIDSSEQNFKAELLIFEKGKASLTNICTDVIIVNAPKPIKNLKKCYGQMTIGKSDPTDYYGNEMPKMTISIDNLTFTDPQTGEEIKIENELFWKVLNTGTPG